MGKIDDAISSFQKALKINPDDKAGKDNLEKALILNIQMAQKRSKESPDNPEAYNQLGVAFARQGNWGGAIDHFQGALRLKPEYQEALENLKKAMELADRKRQ